MTIPKCGIRSLDNVCWCVEIGLSSMHWDNTATLSALFLDFRQDRTETCTAQSLVSIC